MSTSVDTYIDSGSDISASFQPPTCLLLPSASCLCLVGMDSVLILSPTYKALISSRQQLFMSTSPHGKDVGPRLHKTLWFNSSSRYRDVQVYSRRPWHHCCPTGSVSEAVFSFWTVVTGVSRLRSSIVAFYRLFFPIGSQDVLFWKCPSCLTSCPALSAVCRLTMMLSIISGYSNVS